MTPWYKYWWYVYIVRCADGTLYTGISTEPERRAETHNKGAGALYTRPASRRPVKLVYSEGPFVHGEAARREAEIKRMSRREKLKLVSEQP